MKIKTTPSEFVGEVYRNINDMHESMLNILKVLDMLDERIEKLEKKDSQA